MHHGVRHVILDRDGVLNVECRERGYVGDASEWQWVPGALEGLVLLGTHGIRVSVATNQSCIGRGLVARGTVDAIHARMLEDVRAAGGSMDHVFVCPHAPSSGCACRKPAPGLLLDALGATGMAAEATVALGDDVRDIEAARAAHIPAALVRTGKGRQAEVALAGSGIPVFDDLPGFAAAIVSGAWPPSTTGARHGH